MSDVGVRSQADCGRDKRVPPEGNLEGHARRARGSEIDDPTWCTGPDKQVPPTCERGKRVPAAQKLRPCKPASGDSSLKASAWDVLHDRITPYIRTIGMALVPFGQVFGNNPEPDVEHTGIRGISETV